MNALRSARLPALLLLAAAALGLLLANSPAGAGALALQQAHVGVPGILELSIGHVISEGLLAVFFFVAAVELQFELTSGRLSSPRRALRPAIAAAGGVIVPILVYLVVAGADAPSGWPVPTATDIAFALGVLAVFGSGLPPALRVFLLALAILDDIVGIVFIAVLFTADVDVLMLVLAIVALIVARLLARRYDESGSRGLLVALVAVAVLTWWLVLSSGVHATIAGVALGLVLPQQPAMRARHRLEPWVNGLVLPLFALSAALVPIPAVAAGELSPAFWGILIALPVGKMIGIVAAGWLSMRGSGVDDGRLAFGDLLAAGALGGIGFTVSLLLAELSFDGTAMRDEAVLGVLAGSAISLVAAAMLVSWRAWHYRRTSMAR